MIDKDQHWTISIPHESSGPCYTYDPPYDSEPGFASGMYIIMNSTEDWDADLQMFLHRKGKFFYQNSSAVDTIKIQHSKLKSIATGHPRISSKQDFIINRFLI